MNTLTPTPYVRLRREHARKLGPRAIGGVTYELLANPARDALFITIVGNDGAGCWSREVVPVRDVEAAITIGGSDPFPTRRLSSAFTGRSVNNAGFLAAALAHEGLIQPASYVRHHLVFVGDWDAWRRDALAVEGEPVLAPPVAAASTSAAEPAPTEASEAEAARATEPASGDTEVVSLRQRRGQRRGGNDASDS